MTSNGNPLAVMLERQEERGRPTMRCALWAAAQGGGDGTAQRRRLASTNVTRERSNSLSMRLAASPGPEPARHACRKARNSIYSVCNCLNLRIVYGPVNATEQRCAGTLLRGMQSKSSAERLTASHDIHPCILGLLVIGRNPKPTKPDHAGVRILRLSACAPALCIYQAMQARQASRRGGEDKPRD